MRFLSSICFVVGFTIGTTSLAGEQLLVENLANQVWGLPIEQITRKALPEGKEEQVLQVLRSKRVYSVLFRLNDQPAIDEFFAKYREKRGLDYQLVQQLGWCKAPYILDELAPSLYEGPDFEVRATSDGYYTDYGYTVLTAKVMTEILASAPEFPESVRKSVDPLVGEHPATMRAWWEANEKALREERYGDVKPVERGAPKAFLTPSPLHR